MFVHVVQLLSYGYCDGILDCVDDTNRHVGIGWGREVLKGKKMQEWQCV